MQTSHHRVSGGNVTKSAAHGNPPRWLYAFVVAAGICACIGLGQAVSRTAPAATHNLPTHANTTGHRP